MALEIRKKSLLVWKFIDTVNIKEFIPSRFSVNTLDNTVTVIYKDGANSQTYNLSEIQLYDLGSISPFPTFVTIEAFMLKLEQMNCPCFPEISVIGGVQSVVAGANVTVDNTDPLNPIVSAEQDLQSVYDNGDTQIITDYGNVIDLSNNIELIGDEAYVGAISEDNGKYCYLAIADLDDGAEPYINLVNNDTGGEINVRISNLTGVRNRQEPDADGTYALVEDGYIPLTGTEVGSPVTGDIEFTTDGSIIKLIQNDRLIEFNGCEEWLKLSKNNSSIILTESSAELTARFDGSNVQTIACKNDGSKGILVIDSLNNIGLESDNYYGANYDDNTYVQKKYVDDNFASKSATEKTGTALTFTSLDIYGTFTTPSTTNIKVDLTGAKLGIVQKMYHQNGTAPTFPAGFVKISGTYSTVGKNIIYFEFSEGTRVEYWIVNL